MTHKRKSEGDANPNPSKYRTRDRGNQWASTKETFERFLAAYCGEHDDALGGDFPLTNLFVQKECAVFVSTSSSSRLLSAPQESTTYIYDTSSQNAAIEIRIWVADQRHSECYNLVRSVVLNSEVMVAPLVRVAIPNSSPLAVRETLERVIPRVSTEFKLMSAALRPWQDAQYGVECLIFELRKSRLWIRERPDSGNEVSKISQHFQENIDDLGYITILRTSEHEDLRFVDEFWEYQLERCRKDGIYWGYNINRTMPKLSNGKDDLPFTHQVLRGMLAAPHLPWFKRPGSKLNDWLSHPFKATFTSIEEWEAVFTIALLQDVEWDRTSASIAYASIGNHSMRVVEDEKDPSHFWLHITAATSGIPPPKVTAGTVFKLNNASNTDAESTIQQLEARAVDIEGCNDLVLELRVKGKKKARPWGDNFRTGFQSQVSLDPNLNIQGSLRQLNAIELLKFTANEADIDVLIGRPARNYRLEIDDQSSVHGFDSGMLQTESTEDHSGECSEANFDFDMDVDMDVDMDGEMESDKSSATSEVQRRTTESPISFQETLEKLRDTNFETFQAHIDWQTRSRANELQSRSIMAGLQNQVTFVQGPPGTGKSDVACTEAMWVACLGKNVLITAPTNAAGKSNATKLSKTLSHISWILRWKLQCVYFPTWKESIDRIYEHCGCQMAVVTQPGDDLFEQFQIWRLAYEYAVQRLNSGHKDQRAKSFIDTVCFLKATAGAGMMIDTNERDELTSTFKHLAGQVLCQKNINFIVMSTCNNSAVLDRIPIKFDYLVSYLDANLLKSRGIYMTNAYNTCDTQIIDEAGAALEYDIAVALQIKHEGVLMLGDHLQGRPVIESRGHNDFYNQASVSGFERTLQYTEQDCTVLRISYRFGQQIADGVGIFGGYGGLGSGVARESNFYKEFESFWLSDLNLYANSLVYPPGDSQYYRDGRDQKKYHRLALNVADGHSSPPSTGNSTVNYANVDAGITFLLSLVESTTITGKDIMVGTPFVSQAAVWRQQLNIRWPDSSVEVVTGGVSQGKEKRLMVADFTIANETEGAFLGLLREWNRPNVLQSRGQDVLINLFNFDLMRPRLESLYLQNPTWAYFLLDHLDSGDMYTVSGSSVLPASDEEYHGARESWTLVQRPSDVKKLYYSAIQPSQNVPEKASDGKERYTSLEKMYLSELAEKRRKANAKIEGVLDSEREWQEFWAVEKVRMGVGILDDDDL